MLNPIVANESHVPQPQINLFPLELEIPRLRGLFNSAPVRVALRSGLTTLVGPNAVGKTQVLRAIKGQIQKRAAIRRIRFLAAGRSAPLETYRAAVNQTSYTPEITAGVGHSSYLQSRWGYESLTGDLMALDQRADLRIKVEARLQMLFRRMLDLRWGQHGLELSFTSAAENGTVYSSNFEASGIIQLAGILAALYDDEVGALLIDEPEMSLHPQLQAFLLQEIQEVAGNPLEDPTKKLIVLSTHSANFIAIRRLEQISSLVLFTDAQTLPRQVPSDAPELASRHLSALIVRLGDSHRAAFFAKTIFLVEGPSDEIIVNALAARLALSLGGAGVQVIPVTGKGQIPETVKLFNLMGKRVAVLADLDALADDNALVNIFSFADGARQIANTYGSDTLVDLDGPIRSRISRMLDDRWKEIASLAESHRYISQKAPDVDERLSRRRAMLAVLLSTNPTTIGQLTNGADWLAARTQIETLLGALAKIGCFVLHRGTIEDYYTERTSSRICGKPDAAADEAASFPTSDSDTLREQYTDVVRAIEYAAPETTIDENRFLRGLLGGLLATAFQHLKPDLSDSELNAFASVNNKSALSVFRVENISAEQGTRAIRVDMTSNLFPRGGFPFDIRFEDNLNSIIEQKLPS